MLDGKNTRTSRAPKAHTKEVHPIISSNNIKAHIQEAHEITSNKPKLNPMFLLKVFLGLLQGLLMLSSHL